MVLFNRLKKIEKKMAKISRKVKMYFFDSVKEHENAKKNGEIAENSFSIIRDYGDE